MPWILPPCSAGGFSRNQPAATVFFSHTKSASQPASQPAEQGVHLWNAAGYVSQMRCKWTSKDRIAMEKQSNSLLKKNTAAFKRCIRPNVWIKIESTNQLLSKLIVLLNGRVPLLCQLWNQSRCLHRKIGIRCLIQRMQIQCRTGPHWLLCEK